MPWSAMGVRVVFLVGFMGSGKNTVGQELARRLGWDFIDLDAQTEQRERRTIPEIFRTKGESAFRVAETAALRDVLTNAPGRNRVVALGGGAFVEENNRALLRDWPTVFLDAPADELWRRCQRDGVERPLRKDRGQFSRLLAERLPFYHQATATVETSGKELPSICSEIERALRLRAAPESLSRGESH
ncbi:MAG: shikimate kinase [Terriglobales bacterium]